MKGRTLDAAVVMLSDSDNVATAIADLPAGREFEVDGRTVTLVDPVDFGHKFALAPLDPGDRVVKYGQPIGRVTQQVVPGEWVHTHNVESVRGRPSDGGETER